MKRLPLHTLFFTFFAAVASAQGSDDCSTAEPIAGYGVFPFDTNGATTGTEGQANVLCDFFGSTVMEEDVWFAWTAPETDAVRLSTCGAIGDTKIAVYDGPVCPTLEPVVCNDDFCGLLSEVEWEATAGSTYMLHIANFPGQSGSSGDLELSPAGGGGGGGGAPPENDDCENATEISESFGFFDGTNENATTDGPDVCGPIESDVWYAFEMPAAGVFSLGVFPTSMQGMQVFLTDELGASPPAGCPLDVPGQCGGDPSFSFFTFPVDAGDVCVLRVGIVPGGIAGGFGLSFDISCDVPEISSQPVGGALCVGDSHTFSVSAFGSEPLTYQWFHDGAPVSGATNTTLTISDANAANAGAYKVVVTNPCGVAISNLVTLAVSDGPVITLEPVGGDFCEGDSHTMTVDATGTGDLSFQWFKDGTEISGETSPSLSFSSLTTSDTGVYTVVVGDSCGTRTSTPAQVVVFGGPQILEGPIGDSVCLGDPYGMFVEAGGAGEITFQWSKDGVPIPGETGSILILSSVSIEDSGDYTVEVTDDCASVTSLPAQVSVVVGPEILSQPVDQTACVGSSTEFAVDVSGTPPFTFEWFLDGVPVPGGVANVLTIDPVSLADAGNYSVLVSNPCGGVSSTLALLTVNEAPEITSQPFGGNVCEEESYEFSVTATGTRPLTFEWFHDGSPVGTGPSLSVGPATTADSGVYHVEVSNDCGEVISNLETLFVLEGPEITGQPIGAALCHDDVYEMTVQVSGPPPFEFRWFHDGAIIAAPSSPTLIIGPVSVFFEGDYHVEVSNQCGTVLSDEAFVQVDEPPEIASHPVGGNICVGESHVFSVEVPVGKFLAFQWFHDDVLVGTEQTLTINRATAADAGEYYVHVSNQCGALDSDLAVLSVSGGPEILEQPTGGEPCVDSSHAMFVEASGTGDLSFQWSKDGVPLPGATGPTLSFPSVTRADEGTYTVEVTDDCGSVTSDPASLFLAFGPVINVQPEGGSFCDGSEYTIFVEASPSQGELEYQWLHNSNPVGANSPSLTLSDLSLADIGTYRVEVTDDCGSVSSNTEFINVFDGPDIEEQPVGGDFCSESLFSLSVFATGFPDSLTYQWFKDGSLLTGETQSTLNFPNPGVLFNESGTYTVEVTDKCGSVTSDPATVITHGGPSIQVDPVGGAFCIGDDHSLSVEATPSLGELEYQWNKNGFPLLQENGPVLSLPNLQEFNIGFYNVRVTDDCGSLLSSGDSVLVSGAPVIFTQPAGGNFCLGEAQQLSVKADGIELSYQWFKDGVPIPGATDSNLSFSSLTNADEGSYHVVVTNPCGETISDSTSMLVGDGPEIFQHPIGGETCVDFPFQFFVEFSGTDPVEFQWFRDGAAVPDATGPVLTITSTTLEDAGSYTVRVTDPCGKLTSEPAVLVVGEGPEIQQQPTGGNFCVDDPFEMFVEATGVGKLRFQWSQDGVPIPGATAATLPFPPLIETDGGTYTVEVLDDCGSVTSSTAVLTVSVGPEITSQPVGADVCFGDSHEFSVTATGTPPLTFEWFFNGNLVGTGPTLTFGPVGIEEGVIEVEVSNFCGLVTSSRALLFLKEAPGIKTQPLGANICEEDTHVFSVEAFGGEPLTFEWFHDGNPVGNGPTLTVGPATTADSGVYHVEVSNDCGEVISNLETLFVLENVEITTQPVGAIICAGDGYEFSITATGTRPITYQWSHNGLDLPGSTFDTLIIGAVTEADVGTYQVTVSNDCSFEFSDPVVLDMDEGPEITSQPVGGNACEGGSYEFSVGVSGFPPFTFEWFQDGSLVGTGQTLTITNASEADEGVYFVNVSNSCGETESDLAGFVVSSESPEITTQPVNADVCVGGSSSFFVDASGGGLSFEWFHTSVGGGGLVGTSQTLTIDPATEADAGDYVVRVSNLCGDVESNFVVLNVFEPVEITSQPVGANICEGESHVFSVEATGTFLEFSWRHDGVLVGAGPTFTIDSATTADAGNYIVDVSGFCNVVTSDQVTLSVSEIPEIRSQPVGADVCVGGSHSFSVDAPGRRPVTYQWFKDGSSLPGETGQTLSIDPVSTTNAGGYHVTVTNSCGEATSSTATLSVSEAPAIETQPAGAGACQGDSHVFFVSASGTSPLAFQWFKDGVSLSGETGQTLTIEEVDLANEGSYHAVVTNTCGKDSSSTAFLTVSEAPAITGQPVGAAICAGDSHEFSVEASGTSPFTFQWFKDGALVPGATAQTLTIDSATTLDAGSYHAVVSNECGEVESLPASLTVTEAPEITSQPVGADICAGEGHVFTVEVDGDPVLNSYQWFKDGVNLPGETGPSLIIDPATLADAGSYTVEVANECGSVNSEGAILEVAACGGSLSEPKHKETPPAIPNPCPPCPPKDGDLDPVYLFSGEYYMSETDLSIPGRGMGFAWTRKYRSRVGPDTAQGVGWDFSYDLNISQLGGDLVLDDGNSRADRYELQEDGSWVDDGFFRRITEEPDGTFRVQFPNKGAWEFHPFDGSPLEGKVTASEDRHSNRMEFEYDAQGRLVLIRDTLDREIAVAYHPNGRIASVTDFIGRQVTYEYYQDGDAGGGEGDLASVTSPSVVGTPNGNDFPAGKTTVYTYSTGFADEALNHNLLTITDPKGQTWLVNEYDTSDPEAISYDHVVRQTWGDSGDILDVVYAEVSAIVGSGKEVRRAIVNDRVGNVKELFFDAKNQLVRRREYTGRADPDQPTTDPTDPGGNPPLSPLRPGDPAFFETRTEYNDDTLPTKIVYPDENEVLMVYDEANPNPRARGNMRSRTYLPGSRGSTDQPDGRTETFEYDDGFGGSGCCGTNFVTKHVDFRGNETLHDYDEHGNRIHTQHRIASIVEDCEYNEFGQKTRYTHPDNDGHRRVDDYVFYGPEGGHQEGYLFQLIVDVSGFALTTTYEYDQVGNVVRVIDPKGNDTLVTYNELDQVIRTQSAAVTTALTGSSVRYETSSSYDENDKVVLISVANIDETGAAYPNSFLDTTITYETLNLPVRVEREVDEGSSVAEEFEYDANRNRTLHRKGEAVKGTQAANLVAMEFDERDMVFRISRAVGTGFASTDQVDYNGNGYPTVVRGGIESDPRVTTSARDGYDRITSTTGPMGNVEAVHYDANGNPTSSHIAGELEDVAGSASNVRLAESFSEYDDMDRGTRDRVQHFDPVTQAPIGDGESITDTAWSDVSLMLSVTNDNGHVATASHDTALRLSRNTDAAGNTVDHVYDANSNVVSVTETERSDLAGADEIFTSLLTYDALDRLTSTTNNVGSTWSRAYDSRDNLVRSVDALLRVMRHDYDGLSRPLATRRELGGGLELTTSQGWDDSSRLISQSDDNGNTTTYFYDPLDRQDQVSFADGTSRTVTFDIHDNPVAGADANGTSYASTFDLLDRPTSRTYTPGAGVSSDTILETLAYDGLSRMVRAVDDDSIVSMVHDSLWRTTNETLNGKTTSSTYDGVGNRTSLTYPGGRALLLSHDLLERTKEILDASLPGAPSLVGRYDYVGPFRVSKRTLGNGTVMDLIYDGINNGPDDFGERKIVSVHHHIPGGTTIFDRSTTWDKVGNKISGVTRIPGHPIDGERSGYDAVDRLIHSEDGRSFDTPAPPGLLQAERRQDRDYLLDGVGNRVSVQSSPADSLFGDGSYVTNLMNEYTLTPFDTRSHDENGNLVGINLGAASERTVLYDVHNQMVEHTDVATGEVTRYAYDALGRRIAKTLNATGPSTSELYFYNCWRVIEERDGSDQVLATFVYGNYIDEPFTMQRGGVDHWYHPDDLHNVRAISDSAGLVLERYEYDDFGEATIRDGAGAEIFTSAIGNPCLFTGRRLDEETGWYYYRTRYLDPSIGKFTTRDTIGIWGDVANFGNGFAYVGNNPLNGQDPSGLVNIAILLGNGTTKDGDREKEEMTADIFTQVALAAYLLLVPFPCDSTWEQGEAWEAAREKKIKEMKDEFLKGGTPTLTGTAAGGGESSVTFYGRASQYDGAIRSNTMVIYAGHANGSKDTRLVGHDKPDESTGGTMDITSIPKSELRGKYMLFFKCYSLELAQYLSDQEECAAWGSSTRGGYIAIDKYAVANAVERLLTGKPMSNAVQAATETIESNHGGGEKEYPLDDLVNPADKK